MSSAGHNDTNPASNGSRATRMLAKKTPSQTNVWRMPASVSAKDHLASTRSLLGDFNGYSPKDMDELKLKQQKDKEYEPQTPTDYEKKTSRKIEHPD